MEELKKKYMDVLTEVRACLYATDKIKYIYDKGNTIHISCMMILTVFLIFAFFTGLGKENALTLILYFVGITVCYFIIRNTVFDKKLVKLAIASSMLQNLVDEMMIRLPEIESGNINEYKLELLIRKIEIMYETSTNDIGEFLTKNKELIEVEKQSIEICSSI